ncbi:MAG TPA: sulfatase-like hydrolase/transferase [Acidimicrobiales bacterium]|nr:sulfatase-like hydrolase/transferase [Acidimicrobiales bacterium]
MTSPNILVIMTDEERYPPPYEGESLARFRREQLGARQSIRDGGLEFHRHYAGSTACLPSRTTLFTGQYPSLHGATDTDGMAKKASDPAMQWLDPNSVPTLGDWFRAGGYETHYRGKWHISHSDLMIPGTHEGLMASDETGAPIPEAVAAYKGADRLDPYGFSGWIGREPHGAAKADCGVIRDGVFAEQVVELFGDLAAARRDGPWLAVASFVNPHDIAFNGFGWEALLGYPPVDDDTLPAIPEAPSQADSFTGRPACQEAFVKAWPAMLYEQPNDESYRRLYYYLHKLVDRAIGRILESLEQSGMAEDTVVVFTSDHGDLVGAHGGLMQKWYNAYDEAIRVPLLVRGPGITVTPEGVQTPTSHVDLLPTLLGLAGIDVERAAAIVAVEHDETQTLPGRDLSPVLRGSASAESLSEPLYFMTEDDVARGLSRLGLVSGQEYEPVPYPSHVESVITSLPTGAGHGAEVWKLNHYYERLDEFDRAHGLPANPFAAPPADPAWELHNLTADPEERQNRVADTPDVLRGLQGVLDEQRERKRRLPRLHNRSA